MPGILGGNNVVGLIKQWKPNKWYRSEKKFEKDLAKFLRNNLGSDGFGLGGGNKPTVRTQSRKNKVDIRVGNNTGIELKRKLTTGKIDRLMGQIGRYELPTIIVVVCGAKENGWEELTERINKEYGQQMGMQQQEVIPIRKEKGRSQKRRRSNDPFNLGGGSDILGI